MAKRKIIIITTIIRYAHIQYSMHTRTTTSKNEQTANIFHANVSHVIYNRHNIIYLTVVVILGLIKNILLLTAAAVNISDCSKNRL